MHSCSRIEEAAKLSSAIFEIAYWPGGDFINSWKALKASRRSMMIIGAAWARFFLKFYRRRQVAYDAAKQS